MGLRLKGQMLALFLALYVCAMVILVYFNMSVLTQATTLQSQERARGAAVRVAQFVMTLAPRGVENPLLALAADRHSELTKYLETVPHLRYIELLTPTGQKLFRYGSTAVNFADHDTALAAVRETRQPYDCLWGYTGEVDTVGRPVQLVTHFSNHSVSFEYYSPLFLGRGGLSQLDGVVHVSLDVPHAPLRIRVVGLVNLVLGMTFLCTALLAINLWGEHAINRPLRGLVEAMGTLDRRPDGRELVSTNELVNVSKSFNRMALEQVKYQRELEENTRRLEQANDLYRSLNERLEQEVEDKTRDMKEFFSLVTHDLRIPLAAIQGYTDLLSRRQGELNERQEKFVQRIAVANGQALELVRNLLEAMKYEFGQPRMVMQDFDLRELVDEVVSQVSVQHPSDSPIEVDIPDELGPVHADRARIARVVTNLVANAVRHSPPEEKVVLSARPVEGQVEVEVRDHGSGIPAEHLPLLFQKFTQFPSSEGPSSGLGLGLYIVGRILEGHDSSCQVDSREGEGTSFRFRLQAAARRGEDET